MSDYRLILGDCREALKALPGGSVDAVITDPPYGQTNEDYDTGVHPEIWAECFRMAKPGAALLSFTGSPTYHRLASAIEGAGWKVRQMWAWIYRDGMITSAWPKEGFDRLAPAFDPICFATKGKVLLDVTREGQSWNKTDQSGWSRKPIGLSTRSGKRKSMSATGRFPRTLVSDGSEPFEYFLLPRAGRKPDQVTGHPNQKPLSLLSWLLDKVPGETILDPFMGSGTTGVACLQAGRNFIGIEKVPAYYDIAEKRLAEAASAGPLFQMAEAGA